MLADPTTYRGTVSLREFARVVSSEPLPQEEEELLTGQVRVGDEAVLDRLVRAHLRVVVDEAIAHRGGDLPIAKLVRAGVGALVASARHYDPARDGSFSGHARRWIRQAMRSELLSD
jgi:RNA polymerase primary sigma factor